MLRRCLPFRVRERPRRWPPLPAPWALLLLLGAMPGQTPPPAEADPIERLVAELRGLPKAAYAKDRERLLAEAAAAEAKATALEADAAAWRQRAAALRKEAETRSALEALLLSAPPPPAPLPASNGPASERKDPPPAAPATPAGSPKSGEDRRVPSERDGTTPNAKPAVGKPPAAPIAAPGAESPTRPAATPAAGAAAAPAAHGGTPGSPKPPPAEDARAAPPAPATEATPDRKTEIPNFDDHVRPLFEQRCTRCHGGDSPKAGLSLASYAQVLRGGGSGEVLRAGDAEQSRLVRVLSHVEQPTMPPDGRIPDAELERVRRWIDAGAPENAAAAAKAGRAKIGGAPAAPPPAKVGTPVPALVRPEGPAPKEAERGARRTPLRAMSASRASLLALPEGNAVVLRDAESLRLLARWPFPGRVIEVLRFTRDGDFLLAAGGDPGLSGRAVLFDVRSGAAVASFEVAGDTVLAAAVSPRHTLVALGLADKTVRILRTNNGDPAASVGEHNDWVTACAFSPDGNWLASGDRAGVVVVSEADTGLNLHVLKGHTGSINALAWTPDAKSLVSASADGTLRIHEIESGRVSRTIRGTVGEVLDVAVLDNGGLVAAGSAGRVRAFGADGTPRAQSPVLSDWLYSVAIGDDGRRVFAGSARGELHVLDGKTLAPLPAAAP